MKHGKNHLSVMLAILGMLLITASPGIIQAQMDDSGIARAFKWRNIGPANMSGRVADIEAADSDRHPAVSGNRPTPALHGSRFSIPTDQPLSGM
jgi:hypothetical protein